MVICNIVHDPEVDWDSEDGRILKKYDVVPAINVITDITHLDTSVPTIFYGNLVAKANLGADKVNRHNKRFNSAYSWTYSNAEVAYENWIDEFVNESTDKWFSCVQNGIDVVFEEFNAEEFAKHLNPWPLIHEGLYEVYIGDWRDGDIVIHSIKKDTLEYIGKRVDYFLNDLYEALGREFLSIDPKAFANMNGSMLTPPVFLDLALASNSDQWIGIGEIIDYYSNVRIDRSKVIVWYLKQSEFLRPNFSLYR